MVGAIFRPLWGRGWRRAALLGAGSVAVAAAVWFLRGSPAPRAAAQSIPSPQVSAPAVPSDYADRVVAYVHQSQAITRQDLGEYLIARYGADKLPLLVHKRLLDRACAGAGVSVTAAEIENALNDELKDLAVDRDTFIKTVLSRYKKNLFEFKEDILRPRLQLTRLCQPTITVTDEDLKKAFESAHGERIECRLILWPAAEEAKATQAYPALRDSEEEFVKAAKAQNNDLAGAGGRIKPISRWSSEPSIEKAAFELRPGQVSELLKTAQGIVLIKCDRRLPADTAVNFEATKGKLASEIREAKLQFEMGKAFAALRERAGPVFLLKKADRPEDGPLPPPTQPVATLNRDEVVTREELGEFLVARIGAEKLSYLVNRRVLEIACRERNIGVTDAEIDQALAADLKLLDNVTVDYFQKNLLPKWNKTMYEWREDVIRTRLLLTRLAEARVRVTDEDLSKCFEAHYGEKVACRMILWPPEQARSSLRDYARVRDSETEFDRAARAQPSPTLSRDAGKLPPFGRHSLGDENLEREAFRLQPGEVSPMIGTPLGDVLIKCDKRIPADTSKKLDQERARLMKEVHDKKTQVEAQAVFKELYEKAAPRLHMTGTGQPEDLAAQTRKIMSDLPPIGAKR